LIFFKQQFQQNVIKFHVFSPEKIVLTAKSRPF